MVGSISADADGRDTETSVKATWARTLGSLGAAWILLAAVPGPTSAQQRGFQPTDYYDLVGVSEVAVSPEGDLVAFTVTRTLEEENRRRREIWLQALENGRPAGEHYRITAPTGDSYAPTWSPDESLLSFTSERGDDDNSTWFLRVSGPGGEAFHIEGVRGAPVWSVDGEWIAYLALAEGTESEERDGWIAPDAVSNTLDADRFDGRVVTSTRYKADGTITLQPHFSANEHRDLYLVSAEGGAPRRLTSLAFDKSDVRWSSDGRTIYFSGDEHEDDESSDALTRDIWAVRLADGSVTNLTPSPGSEASPSPSPDGTRLAYVFTAERGAERDLMVVDVGNDGRFTTEPVNLTEGWDLEPGSPQWSADGTAILFAASVGGNRHLLRVPAAGGPVVQVTAGERRLTSISLSDRGHIMAYAATDAVSPTELYVARGDATAERRVTEFNTSLLDRVSLEIPERLTWTVGDSVEVEGWVIKPVGYVAGRKYPLILKIHGGPHSAYGNTFFPTFHVLSAAGFFVLYANPRGSSGYGHEFMYSTRGQWGVMDSEDFLTGVDAALARYPDADTTRLGVSGGSYGGFMTNWLTATTDRFQAAATSRSIANWESWWGSSDAQGLTEYEFLGAPWERRDLYRRLSPISYVENVTAPTLIIHSEQDFRTPIGDGEQWFMALKSLDVPVEMVRYPRSSHGLSRTGEPWLIVDRLERIRSWFAHWLVDQAPTVSDGGE
jgi:dipeptidyl aminopeptidase/acylaminoacyl peptidase